MKSNNKLGNLLYGIIGALLYVRGAIILFNIVGAFIGSVIEEEKYEYFISGKYIASDIDIFVCLMCFVTGTIMMFIANKNYQNNENSKNIPIVNSYQQATPVTTNYWNCPKCGSSMHKNDRFCQKCGTSKPVAKAGAGEWVCPSCGRINQNYVGTCGCGARKT